MYIDVPRIVDKSPARDLELRGRVKERHEGREQALRDHEAKLLIAVLPTPITASVLILEFAVQ
jgi:hypothetical protein